MHSYYHQPPPKRQQVFTNHINVKIQASKKNTLIKLHQQVKTVKLQDITTPSDYQLRWS